MAMRHIKLTVEPKMYDDLVRRAKIERIPLARYIRRELEMNSMQSTSDNNNSQNNQNDQNNQLTTLSDLIGADPLMEYEKRIHTLTQSENQVTSNTHDTADTLNIPNTTNTQSTTNTQNPLNSHDAASMQDPANSYDIKAGSKKISLTITIE